MTGPHVFRHTGTFKSCLQFLVDNQSHWRNLYLTILQNLSSKTYHVVDDDIISAENNFLADRKLVPVMRINLSQLSFMQQYFTGLLPRLDLRPPEQAPK